MNNINLDNLQKNCEQRLEQLMSEVDQLQIAYGKIEKTKLLFKKVDVKFDVLGFENLLKYRIFLGIVSMDLCSAILIHTKSNSNYENIYSARQIIIIINEAYKKIYNFLSENKFGDIIRKYRNKSYWIKEIGNIIENELPELQNEYKEITKDLDEYLNVNFRVLQIQRNLSIHYDKNPIKVYKMLIDLNVDETFKLLIPFMKIINGMYIFTDKLRDAFKIKANLKSQEIDQNFDGVASSLDKIKNNENEEQIEEIQEIIKQMKNI